MSNDINSYINISGSNKASNKSIEAQDHNEVSILPQAKAKIAHVANIANFYRIEIEVCDLIGNIIRNGKH